jgi:hypothetical protein
MPFASIYIREHISLSWCGVRISKRRGSGFDAVVGLLSHISDVGTPPSSSANNSVPVRNKRIFACAATPGIQAGKS